MSVRLVRPASSLLPSWLPVTNGWLMEGCKSKTLSSYPQGRTTLWFHLCFGFWVGSRSTNTFAWAIPDLLSSLPFLVNHLPRISISGSCRELIFISSFTELILSPIFLSHSRFEHFYAFFFRYIFRVSKLITGTVSEEPNKKSQLFFTEHQYWYIFKQK